MRISVVTAVFNNGETISDALDSVLSQAGVELELIVIDGGSIDGTQAVLKRYTDRLAVLVSEPDRGIYDALNKGIRRCTGDVVGFLHSDDLLAGPNTLSGVAAAFADGDVDAVYGDLVYVRKHDPDTVVRYWRAGAFSRRRLGWGWMPPHPTLYVRRSVYEEMSYARAGLQIPLGLPLSKGETGMGGDFSGSQQSGLFDTTYRIAADYDCMLRLLARDDVRVRYIPEVLVKMRLGGVSNRSLRGILRKSAEDYRALRSNGVGGGGALIWKNLSKLTQFFKRKNGEVRR